MKLTEETWVTVWDTCVVLGQWTISPGWRFGFSLKGLHVKGRTVSQSAEARGLVTWDLRVNWQVIPGGSDRKNPPAMWETWVQSLGQENLLGKGLATHSSILAWRIPWTEEPGGLQSVRLQKVGHDWMTNTSTLSYWWVMSVGSGLGVMCQPL